MCCDQAVLGGCCLTTSRLGRRYTTTSVALPREGVFGGINEALRKEVRAKAGRDEQPRAGILDSQSVKTTEKGGYAATMQPSTSRAGIATS